MSSELNHGRFSRRRFLHNTGLLGAIAALPGLTACGSSSPLRIMVHDWPGYVFLRYAYHQGLIPANQVELTEERGLGDSVGALERGEVDGAAITLDNALHLLARGTDLSVVLVFNVSVGGDALLAEPNRTSPADLVGARVGAEDSALSAVMLNRALASAGLARDAIEVVPFTGSAVEAWNAGNLDAILTYQPAVQALTRQGLVTLFDSRQIPLLITDVLAVRRTALAARASAVRHLLAGHFQAQEQWRSDPLNTNYRLASLLQVDPRNVHQVFRGLNIPGKEYNRQYLTAPATDLMTAAQTLGQILKDEGLISVVPNLDALFTADYLPELGQ